MLRGAVSHRVIWRRLAPYTSSGTRKLMCKHLSLRTPSSVHGLKAERAIRSAQLDCASLHLAEGLRPYINKIMPNPVSKLPSL